MARGTNAIRLCAGAFNAVVRGHVCASSCCRTTLNTSHSCTPRTSLPVSSIRHITTPTFFGTAVSSKSVTQPVVVHKLRRSPCQHFHSSTALGAVHAVTGRGSGTQYQNYNSAQSQINTASDISHNAEYRPESLSSSNTSSLNTKEKSAHSAANAVRALVEDEMRLVLQQINGMFDNSDQRLQQCSYYYFDAQGKSIRPMIMLLMSKATNALFPSDHPLHDKVADGQRTLALIAEMIHTSSLVHDDVIDEASTRRNKASANAVFGDTQAIYAGDFILAKAAMALASLNNTEVVSIMSQILDDLVNGEFMQLQNKKEAMNNPALRFELYLQKTYHKTASLLACGCRAVATLVGHDAGTCERAFQYGKDVGMAFQVIDDVLDFVSSSEEMGKPTAADLKLGLATAPVLFAAEEYPELNGLIARRFKGKGDVEKARSLVEQSQGLQRSRELALKYCNSAVTNLEQLPPSAAREGLVQLTEAVLKRSK